MNKQLGRKVLRRLSFLNRLKSVRLCLQIYIFVAFLAVQIANLGRFYLAHGLMILFILVYLSLNCHEIAKIEAAGIYGPEENCYFEFEKDGLPKGLGPVNFRNVLTDILSYDFLPGPSERPSRQKLIDRIQNLEKIKTRPLSGLEIASLTAAEIHLGGIWLDRAMNRLQPLVSDRTQASFVVLSHLSRIHQERMEWDEAFRKQFSAVYDYPFPSNFPQLSELQRKWYQRIEKEVYLPWIRSRLQDSNLSKQKLIDHIDPIFPLKNFTGSDKSVLEFVGENGEYAVGTIASKQKEKLPEDAIAIVQQMVLWNPHDARLYWQLGELYNANGDIEAALQVLDDCVAAPRNYSSPSLMKHRAQIRSVIENQQKEKEQKKYDEQQQRDQLRQKQLNKIYLVGGFVLVILLGLLYNQWREIVRRRNRNTGN